MLGHAPICCIMPVTAGTPNFAYLTKNLRFMLPLRCMIDSAYTVCLYLTSGIYSDDIPRPRVDTVENEGRLLVGPKARPDSS